MSSSGSRDGLSLIGYASSNYDSIGGTIQAGIMGAFLAVFTFFIDFWASVAGLFIGLISAVGESLQQLAVALLGSPAEIVIAGAQETVASITGRFGAGPFSFALGIAAVLVGLYLVNVYVSREETGNLFPGLPFDVPTPGFEGPEEDEEQG